MRIKNSANIAGRTINADNPTYVVAEIGVNHNGDPQLAHRMVDAAKAAGADAVKFQTYRTADLVLDSAQRAKYQEAAIGLGTQEQMLSKLELPFEVFAEIKTHCEEANIDFMSTAFDPISLEFVVSLKPVCLKWPSGELTNLPLMRQARQSRLPIILSTGMATIREIAAAVETIGSNNDIVILQCVSNYPARIEDQNFRVLPALASTFGVPVGLSDHTVGPYAAIAARALGMSVLEKHFTLDRGMVGPDHSSSIEPVDFKNMVNILRQIEVGLGDGIKGPLAVELDVKSTARKSMVFAKNLKKGHRLTEGDFWFKRPGVGVPPNDLERYLGRVLSRDVEVNSLFESTDVNS